MSQAQVGCQAGWKAAIMPARSIHLIFSSLMLLFLYEVLQWSGSNLQQTQENGPNKYVTGFDC